jgi:hypothetical protein
LSCVYSMINHNWSLLCTVSLSMCNNLIYCPYNTDHKCYPIPWWCVYWKINLLWHMLYNICNLWIFFNEESHYGEPDHTFCFTLYIPMQKSVVMTVLCLPLNYPPIHTWQKASGELCLFYWLLATIILHLRKHKLLTSGDDLMLCYLYLPLTHLAGGQNCVT